MMLQTCSIKQRGRGVRVVYGAMEVLEDMRHFGKPRLLLGMQQEQITQLQACGPGGGVLSAR